MRKKITILVILTIIAIFAVAIVSFENKTNFGTVSLAIPPVAGKVTILFNGESVSSKATDSYIYDLKSGNYNLVISNSGYKNFTTNFSLKTGQTLLINVSLQPLGKPSAADLSKIVYSAGGYSNPYALSDQFAKGSTATAKYFANNAWAIVTVHIPTGLGLAYFIDKYDVTTGKWVVVTNPSDVIQVENIKLLPIDLQKYLIDNNLISNGGD